MLVSHIAGYSGLAASRVCFYWSMMMSNHAVCREEFDN